MERSAQGPHWLGAVPISVNENLAFRIIDHNTFIYDLECHKLHYMGDTASLIWELIDGKRTGAEIGHLVAAHFDADPGMVEKDALRFLGELVKQRLVRLPEGYGSKEQTATAKTDYSDTFANGLEFAARASEQLIPLDVYMTLTYACNARCYYCYNSDRRSAETNRHLASDWSRDGFLDVLDELASLGTLRLNLTGGEPMMHPRFYDILQRAHELNFAICISTNGTLVDEEAADRIADANPAVVAMTFHAASARLHDSLNQLPGSFERSCRAVSLLRERDVRTEMVFVLSKHNVREVEKDIALARKLDAHFKIAADVKPRSDGQKDTLTANMSTSELEWLMSEGYYVPHHDRCFAGSSRAVIHPDGQVSPCEWVPVVLGDLQNQPFVEVWHSQPAQKIRDERWFDPPDQCASCSFAAYCARCPGRALVEDGDIRAPSSFACYLAKTYARVRARKTAGGGTIIPQF